MRFKIWMENKDIFGFEAKRPVEPTDDDMLSRPISRFDIELMMDLLSRKSIGITEAITPFVNQIQWGSRPGAVRLDVDTGLSFAIQQLGVDRQGNPRWVTRKLFQLNRQGYGGQEDAVAQEIYEHLAQTADGRIPSPQESYSDEDLESLVHHIYTKIKRNAKAIFLPVGVKKLGENNYVICLEVRGHGVQNPQYNRVEQNQTQITYDKDQGTIRIANYNIESRVGGSRSWTLQPMDLECYFFPNQGRDEISEIVAVHMKYY